MPGEGEFSGLPVFARCAWRLIPFMTLLYIVGFIDRSNVGFAALTMNRDLGFSDAAYGLGAGMFFLGYLTFQIPTAVLLARLGARRVIFCVMLAWGLVSASNAFMRDAHSFYALRFLLGVAEGGFTPCMIYYLTLWFPLSYRGRFTAIFCTAIPIAGIISGPLSGLLLGMDGTLGLHGWQWLFLIQGFPAVLLAFIVLSCPTVRRKRGGLIIQSATPSQRVSAPLRCRSAAWCGH
jgi:ACS family tartrate transporter-like MFS transporter